MITLTQEQVKKETLELWQEARSTYTPEALVAILYGGEFIGDTIYEASGIPLYKIIIRRPNRRAIYQKIARWNKFIAWLVYELLFLLDDPRVIEPISLPTNKKLLVVDDGIHTGKTLRSCRIALRRFKPTEIRVLSFMDLSGKNLADYTRYREKVSFPWSLDNPEQ